MAWRPARALPVWHAQMKAVAPRAVAELPASVWGLRAGASHAQSGGHYPHYVPGLGSEIVTAADAPDDPGRGLDLFAHLDAIRVSRDERVLYAISRDRMFSSYSAHGYPPFTWRPYNASDPNRDRHNTHGHLQVVDDTRADIDRPWATAGGTMYLTDKIDQTDYDAVPTAWQPLPATKGQTVAVVLGTLARRAYLTVLGVNALWEQSGEQHTALMGKLDAIGDAVDAFDLPVLTGVTEDDLRRIVREELTLAMADLIHSYAETLAGAPVPPRRT